MNHYAASQALPILIALAVPAWAVEQPVPTVTVHGDAASDDQADSTSRTTIPLKDLAASIQVVPRELLRERGVTRTDQLLDNVSGVLAEASYGGNGATFFNIRGFSENNGLRDGFRNYGYLAFRDVQNIERVEVFKGPAGALYGGVGAIGGYVNTVSKRPQQANFGDAGLTLGTAGLARTTLDVNRMLENGVTVRLNGALDKNSGFRDDTGTRSWSLAPSISWVNSAGTSLTLLTEFNHLERDAFDFGVPNIPRYQDLARTRYYGDSGDFGKNDTQAATLLFEHALNDQWRARLSAHVSHAHQLSQQSFPDLFSYAGGSLLDYSVYSGANESSKQVDVQAELVGKVVVAGMQHAILAGIDYGYLAQGGAGSAVSALTLDLFDPRDVSTLAPVAAAGPYHEARGKDLGVYVQDLIAIAPQFKLHLGLRADRFDNRELLGDAQTARGGQNAISPRVGLVWQPNGRTSFFTDWSRSHAPNVAHSITNSTYDAEVGQQVEAGVKQEIIRNRLHASLAVFDLKRANMLTNDPLDPTRQVLTGRQNSRGVEFDIAGTVAPGWKVIGAYTWLDAVVKSDTSLPIGDALSNVPRHHASVWSTHELQNGAWKGLGFGAGVYYVGAREANLPNIYRLPGYARVDASLSYRSGPWRTQLNVANLFNRRYVSGGAASVFNYALAPSQPLAAQLTLAYHF
ncbi:TonB-dependent receptor [Massilia sp. S19_KUP03_FR1]|uniref:TonB-dependent receptor n=1 Tax=Massilia sp. S19_KUP03_FR1 TaxID=3025503 RepID=UPI002FCD66AF